jgi:chemotaxis methyl-accepting protein methylase
MSHVKSPNDKTFVDLGSGKGKIVLEAGYKYNFNKSYGIELCTNKYTYSEKMLKLFQNKFGKSNIIFKNVNMFHPAVNWTEFDIIYISNLCFTDDMNRKIAEKFDSEGKIGSIIFSSKEIPVSRTADKKILSVKQSWNDSSNINMITLH